MWRNASPRQHGVRYLCFTGEHQLEMGKWGKLSHVLFIYLFLVGELICVFFSLALVFCVLQGVILLVNLRSVIANDSPGISSFKITVRSGVCFVFPHYFPHYFPHSFSPLFFPIIFTIIFPILIFPIIIHHYFPHSEFPHSTAGAFLRPWTSEFQSISGSSD